MNTLTHPPSVRCLMPALVLAFLATSVSGETDGKQTMEGGHPSNVRLTIDDRMQRIVEAELDRGMSDFKARRGTVIVMEPDTGAVLAMACRPHFNLDSREGETEGAFNFATQGEFEPGSLFTVVGMSAALEHGVIGYDTEIDCHSGLYLDGPVKVPDHHPYGMLSAWKVLQKSSNIGSCLIARQLGRERFHDHARALGFGEKTGIDLLAESIGRLNDSGNEVDFSRLSYGYGVAVTPIQVAAAYSAIANGGRLMRPRLVDAVLAPDGKVIETRKPVELRRVFSEETARLMRKALANVCTAEGTASRAMVDGSTVAGKTGTARKTSPEGRGYLADSYVTSFAGMLPAADPEYVCVVVIDDPTTTEVARYGGTIAAPVFSRIAGRISKLRVAH